MVNGDPTHALSPSRGNGHHKISFISPSNWLGSVIGEQQNTGIVAGPGPFQHARENAISRMRATLGDEVYENAFHQGTVLSIEEVYALALSPERRHPPPATFRPNR